MKKIILATIGASLTLFTLGGIIHVGLFHDMDWMFSGDASHALRDEMLFSLVLLSELLYGFLLAMIYTLWGPGFGIRKRLFMGAILGLIIGMNQGLWMYSLTNFVNISAMAFYGITVAIRFAMAALVVNFILDSLKD